MLYRIMFLVLLLSLPLSVLNAQSSESVEDRSVALEEKIASTEEKLEGVEALEEETKEDSEAAMTGETSVKQGELLYTEGVTLMKAKDIEGAISKWSKVGEDSPYYQKCQENIARAIKMRDAILAKEAEESDGEGIVVGGEEDVYEDTAPVKKEKLVEKPEAFKRLAIPWVLNSLPGFGIGSFTTGDKLGGSTVILFDFVATGVAAGFVVNSINMKNKAEEFGTEYPEIADNPYLITYRRMITAGIITTALVWTGGRLYGFIRPVRRYRKFLRDYEYQQKSSGVSDSAEEEVGETPVESVSYFVPYVAPVITESGVETLAGAVFGRTF